MNKLFDLMIKQTGDIDMGVTCMGETLLTPAEKGHFSGEQLSGIVEPVGVGVVYTPQPGVNDIKSTMLLHTDDGADILMEINAYFDIAPEKEALLAEGTFVEPEEYYYKGTVSFKTGDAGYKWLERKVCICEGVVNDWENLLFRVYMA